LCIPQSKLAKHVNRVRSNVPPTYSVFDTDAACAAP
jgi:hypothetical protein